MAIPHEESEFRAILNGEFAIDLRADLHTLMTSIPFPTDCDDALEDPSPDLEE